jgi:4-methyl-5(b-hydroxyethyl)-thiazole monophosphate biosynthesis
MITERTGENRQFYEKEVAMKKTILVPIAPGIEEIEAVTIIDVLRRAGAEVVVASVSDLQIVASRGVKLVADKFIADCARQTFDLIALPGGMPGAEHLGDCAALIAMLKAQHKAGRFYAAICASPAVVLQVHGLLEGRQATCHPAFAENLTGSTKASIESRVVVDTNCVTSRGPGTAMEFALKLVELLYSPAKAKEVAAPMLVNE